MIPLRDINPTRVTPILTFVFIIANLAIWFLWQPHTTVDDEAEFLYERAAIACELTTGEALSIAEINGDVCFEADGNPVFPDKNVYLAALVSMFLHGSLFHVFANMWFLFIFGNNVEEAFGPLSYLTLYLITGIAATAGFVMMNADSAIPLVGASGAVAGVLGAYAVLFPRHQILTLFGFFFVPVSALFFLGLWLFGQFFVGDASVAWEAHVVGFITGSAIAAVFRRPLLRRVRDLQATAPARFAR